MPQVMPVSVPVQNLAYAAQQSGALGTTVSGGSVVLLQPNSQQAQPGPSHSPNSKSTIFLIPQFGNNFAYLSIW